MTHDVTPLTDKFGRVHDNLRISVTDRCNVRCFYCMPEEGVKFMDRREILSFEEIERFVRAAVPLGITKLRITGGEPLVRRDLPLLIEKLAAIPGIRDIALTTNGVLLERQARDLYAAGLRRLNIHLDTLDRERFLANHPARRSAPRSGRHRSRRCRGFREDQIQHRRSQRTWWSPTSSRWRSFAANGVSSRVSSSSCRSTRNPSGTAAKC